MDIQFKKTGSTPSFTATGTESQIEARLSSEGFDVKQFIRDVATSYDTSREWSQHKKRIQSLADRTAQQLKQNVFKNYVLFIDSSKEISSLEAEMYKLSHYLHEQQTLTRALQSLTIIESKNSFQDTVLVEKRDTYSISILLETVEGGSVVTEVPDRYLVHSGHLYELDQKTHKELVELRAFLLNDSLMMALPVFKRRGPVKYSFQALYELDNMAIVDVKDSDSLKSSFKILMFPDSHLFQAESEEDKRQWIQILETTKRKHKEEVETLKRDAVRRLRSQSFKSSVNPLSRPLMMEAAAVSAEQNQADMLMEEDWIKEVPESLDVYIAQREFDQAVELILKTKSFLKGFSDSHALRDIKARLNHRINRLSEVLMKELETSPSGSMRGGPRAARRAVGFLIKLGRSAEACDLFLENYRQVIKRDINDVKMEGAVNLYIVNFSSTFFTGLRNAAVEFERAFTNDYGSYSAFIVWCSDLLKHFSLKCCKVIFRPEDNVEGHSLSTITDCILSTVKECDNLNDIGLDLSFALWDLYHPYLAEALNSGRKQIREECATLGTAETWDPLDLKKDQPKLSAVILQMQSLGMKEFSNLVHGGIVDLSHTTINFCQMTINFMHDVFRIYTPQLLEDFIGCFCDIFNNMVELYCDALNHDENIAMTECIVNDASFVIETLLPTFISKMNSETGVDIPDLVELHDALHDTFKKRSREGSVEPPPVSTRPAQRYLSGGVDDRSRKESPGSSNFGEDDDDDDDDIV